MEISQDGSFDSFFFFFFFFSFLFARRVQEFRETLTHGAAVVKIYGPGPKPGPYLYFHTLNDRHESASSRDDPRSARFKKSPLHLPVPLDEYYIPIFLTNFNNLRLFKYIYFCKS